MLHLVTWNLGITADPGAVEILRELDAELVLLQEVSPEWVDILQEGLASDYPHMVFAIQEDDAAGLGVLSRLPLSVDALMDSPVGWFPAMRLTVNSDLGPLEVLNVHLVPPFTDGGRLIPGWLTRHDDRKREVMSYLADSVPDLIAGDFNANEHERALRWLRREHSLVSALPLYAPRAKTWKWPHLPAWRLDHVLVGPCLRPAEAEVFALGTSDHWPLRVALEGLDGDGATARCLAAGAPRGTW